MAQAIRKLQGPDTIAAVEPSWLKPSSSASARAEPTSRPVGQGDLEEGKVAGDAGPDDLELKRVRALAKYMREFGKATTHEAKARAWVGFISIETSISATAVRLGLRVLAHIDKKSGIAVISQEELGSQIGLKERQTSSVIQELAGAELLEATPGKWKKTKGRYSLTIPEIGRMRDMVRVTKPTRKQSP